MEMNLLYIFHGYSRCCLLFKDTERERRRTADSPTIRSEFHVDTGHNLDRFPCCFAVLCLYICFHPCRPIIANGWVVVGR